MQEPDIKTKVKNIFENARQMPTFFFKYVTSCPIPGSETPDRRENDGDGGGEEEARLCTEG